MPNKRLHVESVAAFVETIVVFDREWKTAWYRGQGDSGWDLKPRLYRLKKPDEGEIRIDFERVGIQLAQREPGDKWDWYFLMQHYGAPTRLLDWTDGALLALYFAAKDNLKQRELRKKASRPACDAAVWVLDPAWLNSVSIKTKLIFLKDSREVKSYLPFPFRKKKRPKLPISIDPPHVDRRLAAQRSHFTLHGIVPLGLEAAKRKSRPSRLRRIVVDGSKSDEMLEQLAACGISETTVFPDLEGLGREVQYDWSG
jgi:hypothetical protein